MPNSQSFSFIVVARLILCTVGINVCFLLWGILQEDITTKEYIMRDGTTRKFRQYYFLNMCQCVVSSIISFCILVFSHHHERHPSFTSLTKESFWMLSKIGLTMTCASPLGLLATRYVSFPTILVAKTLKMLPVMLVGMLVHGVKYPTLKKVIVLLISVGVLLFSMSSDKAKKGSGQTDSVVGLMLVFFNLAFDAYTNTSQDQLVRIVHFNGTQVMFWANLFAIFWHALVVVASEFVPPTEALAPQLFLAVDMCAQNHDFLFALVTYIAAGGLGQVIIFYVLSHFGSLTLTATTVTRKVFGIVLSIFWNGHQLTSVQWASLVPVFAGVLLDMGHHGSKKKKH
eukprot:PhM_4_TR17833/c0_g1_i1/m.9013/K15275/SLC35B1; solute carrier family 35 (UDP-galactose transporter), member B1